MNTIVVTMIKPHGRNRYLWASIVLAIGPFSGCAARQLQYSTAHQATTITDIQYEQVLNNLARLSQDPNSLPSALDIKTGSTQVSDTGNLGATITYGMGGARGPNFGGSRSVVDQWGTMPITEDNTLKLLSYAYLNAYGYGKLLSPEDANDMAFDLATQMATTADMSTDEDTLKSLINLRNATPLEQAAIILQNTQFFKGDLQSWFDSMKREYEERKNLPADNPVGVGIVRLLREQDLNIDRDFFKKLDAIISLLGDAEKLLKKVTTDEELTIARELDDRRADPAFQNFKTQIMSFFKPALYANNPINAVNALTNIRPFIEQSNRDVMSIYNRLQKEQTLENKYKNTSDKITTIFNEPILIQADDGMFVASRPISTGLVKAVKQKVNDIQKTLKDVPVGWFHVGQKRDVPKNACYVGCHISKCGGCTHACVCDDRTAELADFTLRVLKLSSQFKESQVFAVPSGVQFSPALASPDTRLNCDPLDLVERDLVAGAVVELGGLGAGVVGDFLGLLERAAVLAVGGDAGGPEGVVADGVG